MWRPFFVTSLLLVVDMIVVSADEALDRPRYDKILADIKDAEHPKFRRSLMARGYNASIEKLRRMDYWAQIKDDVRNASQEALQKRNPQNLNDDQRQAVYLYTILNKFYRVLNAKLREGKGAGEFQDYVNLLMSGLTKIGDTGPQTVWRVLNRHRNHSVGDTLTWPAFSSTTYINGSFNVCSSASTLYEIREAYGYNIEAYSSEPEQHEILLPPNTVLDVLEGPSKCGTRYQYVLKIAGMANLGVSLTVSLYNHGWFSTVAMIAFYLNNDILNTFS